MGRSILILFGPPGAGTNFLPFPLHVRQSDSEGGPSTLLADASCRVFRRKGHARAQDCLGAEHPAAVNGRHVAGCCSRWH